MTTRLSAVAGGTGVKPIVACADGDDPARAALAAAGGRPVASWEGLAGRLPAGGCVLVVSARALARGFAFPLPAPSLRVIALAGADGAPPGESVYACLPADTPAPLLARMVENAVDHLRLQAERDESRRLAAAAAREIEELNRIGAALSAEHDTATLLELILTKAREITGSDAGSLYLVEAAEPEEAPQAVVAPGPAARWRTVRPDDRERVRRLRFTIAQNDSVPLRLRESVMALSDRSIAGYAALTGEIVNLADAYELPAGVPYSFNRTFDEAAGYRTRAMLTVPMRTPNGDTVGVLQLINPKRDPAVTLSSSEAVAAQVRPYTAQQAALTASLASQAAVALENSRLYAEIQRLFEGFVRASVVAIEARDPTTCGHSFRVANLTVALAEVVDRAADGPFSALRFTRADMKAIRYAALLHDFGKVGVREEVLVKARKLYPGQLDLIHQRFQFARQSRRLAALRGRLAFVLERGRAAYLRELPALDAALAGELEALDRQLDAILQANEPSVLPDGSFERLLDIAASLYEDADGRTRPLLTDDEVRLLSLRKGSLSDSERVEIESHVTHTLNFLGQIPWTRDIRAIPAIAAGHHEKLNGSGYPRGIPAPEIPVQTRMMTISDIFDALSAADRPYKKAVPIERALDILGYAVADGELDPDLVQVFVEARVYDRWKIEPFPY